jgi:hypothetical protein
MAGFAFGFLVGEGEQQFQAMAGLVLPHWLLLRSVGGWGGSSPHPVPVGLTPASRGYILPQQGLAGW